VVLKLFTGVVMTTAGATPVTVIDLASEPNAFEQATVIVFEPATSGTLAGEVAVVPFTVQVIGGVPVVDHVTLIGETVLVEPVAGELIVTCGAVPSVTFVVAVLDVPSELEHTTLIALAPTESVTGLVVVLVDAAPLTVQVVPAGIVEPPLTV